MLQQSDPNLFDSISFLENGALFQVSSDLFKLVTGPFSDEILDENSLQGESTLVYQPHFWDFIDKVDESPKVFRGASTVTLQRHELLQALSQSYPLRPKLAWQNVDSQPFKEQFQWSEQQFKNQKLKKTVPLISQKSKTRFSVQNLAWVISHLLNERNYGWAYGIWQNGKGFFGQTPELIATWNEGEKNLLTAALAGTVKNDEGQNPAILSDEKIRKEHQFVVDDIEERLQQIFSNSQIEKDETKILKLKHLVHLKTDFKCTGVDRLQAWRVIQALHPTAALGIYPRNPIEMKMFSALPLQNERLSFAAPIVLIEKEGFLALAAIRNFYFSQDEVKIISGCGITSESIYESELSELQLKRESVKRMMGLVE